VSTAKPILPRRLIKRVSLLAYCVLFLTINVLPTTAQVVSFSGSLYRTNGAQSMPISNAQVGLFSTGTGWIGPSITDSYGRYAFFNVPPGQYLLRVNFNGVIIWTEGVYVPGANHIIVVRG
jgi:hypothetical protein